jgi:hypothetical protein
MPSTSTTRRKPSSASKSSSAKRTSAKRTSASKSSAKKLPVAQSTADARALADTNLPAGHGALDVRIDHLSQRSDDDARYGHMVVLPKGDVDGEHVGEIGVYDVNYSLAVDGYPDEVGVTLRVLGAQGAVPLRRHPRDGQAREGLVPQREAAALVAAIRAYAAAYKGDESKKDILDALGTVEKAVVADATQGQGGPPSPGSQQADQAQSAQRDSQRGPMYEPPADEPADAGGPPSNFDEAKRRAMQRTRR